MAYSDKVVDHYENPRNVGTLDKGDPNVGTGLVGAPACGDVMRLQIKVSDEGVIEDAVFKTYGCGSAIASSSLLTEWVKGKTLDEAKDSVVTLEVTDHEILTGSADSRVRRYDIRNGKLIVDFIGSKLKTRQLHVHVVARKYPNLYVNFKVFFEKLRFRYYGGKSCNVSTEQRV